MRGIVDIQLLRIHGRREAITPEHFDVVEPAANHTLHGPLLHNHVSVARFMMPQHQPNR